MSERFFFTNVDRARPLLCHREYSPSSLLTHSSRSLSLMLLRAITPPHCFMGTVRTRPRHRVRQSNVRSRTAMEFIAAKNKLITAKIAIPARNTCFCRYTLRETDESVRTANAIKQILHLSWCERPFPLDLFLDGSQHVDAVVANPFSSQVRVK